MNRSRFALLCLAVATVHAVPVVGQTSSLYVDPTVSTRPFRSINGITDRLSPHIAKTSISAVHLPEPRQFAIHDLVTIIVRESIQNRSDAELESEKDTSVNGSISAFPNLRLRDLLNLQLGQSSLDDGTPQVDLSLGKDFEGEGDYQRNDTFTTRLTARIIDIKPNETLVLEARKFIRSDDESVDVVLSGTCRKDDITIDNTILSTQIYDLRLVKEHQGELRNATKKGLLTKFFDALFNF